MSSGRSSARRRTSARKAKRASRAASLPPVAEQLVTDLALPHLIRDRPSRRELTSLNVERMPKEKFERIADIYSARVGRTLTHWEAFAIMVAETEERYAEELDVMRGRR